MKGLTHQEYEFLCMAADPVVNEMSFDTDTGEGAQWVPVADALHKRGLLSLHEWSDAYLDHHTYNITTLGRFVLRLATNSRRTI
jgi:hypothetical protein